MLSSSKNIWPNIFLRQGSNVLEKKLPRFSWLPFLSAKWGTPKGCKRKVKNGAEEPKTKEEYVGKWVKRDTDQMSVTDVQGQSKAVKSQSGTPVSMKILDMLTINGFCAWI